MLPDMEFEHQLAELKATGNLDLFMARQIWEQGKKISQLPCVSGQDCSLAYSKKQLLITGGSSAGGTAALILIINAILRHFGIDIGF